MHRPKQQLDSNGPEGRVRGTASHIYERYLIQARDAQMGGDNVLAENLYQHAEHYFRVLNLNGQANPQANQSRPRSDADLREDELRGYEVGQRNVLVARIGGRYKALDAVTKVILVVLSLSTLVAVVMAASQGTVREPGFVDPSPWNLAAPSRCGTASPAPTAHRTRPCRRCG